MNDDIKLMVEFKNGNREAFNKLFDKYSKAIINYIYRFTGSKEDSQDLAQDVFIKVYNSASTYTPIAKFTTWIYRIASNISIDYIRKRKTKGIHVSLDEHIENETGSIIHQSADDKLKPVDKQIEEIEIQNNIKEALLTLPENQRAALILKIYEDKSYADIALVLGVSVPSVESLIFRARQSLKGRLKNI